MGACIVVKKNPSEKNKQLKATDKSDQYAKMQNASAQNKSANGIKGDKAQSNGNQNYLQIVLKEKDEKIKKIEESDNKLNHGNQNHKQLEQNKQKNTEMALAKTNVEEQNDSDILKRYKADKSQFNFQWDVGKPNAAVYSFSKEHNKLKYTSSELNRFQLVTTQPFPKEGIHTITVTILKQKKERAICFGFITKKRLDLQSSGDIGDDQSIGYWTYSNGHCQIDADGKLLQKNYTKERLGCEVSGSIQFTLNISKHKIKIQRKINQVQSRPSEVDFNLPGSFKNQQIYAFVSMIQKEDQIQTLYHYQK